LSQQNHEKPFEIRHTALGYKIFRYDKVTSTNDIAKKIAKKDGKERIVILAETQTAGKGRLGRRWISPRGGLWFSIILRPQISPKEALKLTFLTSSAMAKTIKTIFCLDTSVKWPNDVLVNDRKICGILTETSTSKNIVENMVVGVGINANIDLQSFPHSLRNSVTSLKHELGYAVNRKSLIISVLQNFDYRYKRLQRGLWSILLQEWKSMTTFLGEQMEVNSFGEIILGEAWDVDRDGALIIRLENGVLRKIVVGDATLRKKH